MNGICANFQFQILSIQMRTRRQAREEDKKNVSVSPVKERKRKEKAKKNEEENDKKISKPTKKVKKQKTPSPSPQKPKRGRKNQEPARVKDSSKAQKNQKNKKTDPKDDPSPVKDNKKKDKGKDDSVSKEKDKKDPKKQEQQFVKKLVVKGAAPVDEYFEKQRGKNYHVLVHNGNVYSATLNQTNIKNNNNKFYLLQVLQNDSNSNNCFFFTRWGRVGAQGQYSCEGPYTIMMATNLFDQKKRDKAKKGDYRELDMNYGEDEADNNDDNKSDNAEEKDKKSALDHYQDSTLPKPLKDFINLIFDIGMMTNQMRQIGFNVNKMPLGKLSKDNIKKGYGILKELYSELQDKKRESEIERLTNDFYSYIPHDVGFRNMGAFMLNTTKKVQEKLEMLESLAEIKIATQILGKREDGNLIQNNYKKLNREIRPVERDSLTFKLLNDYLQTTHADTHRSYGLQLMDLFSVQSEMEDKRFIKDLHNKMLLWHGSRLTNYVGILSQGLRIAPPEAPVTGYMFGKGVYFADMSSKSANYCFTNPTNNIGILILCQVALGNMNEKFHADYYAANLPEGKHSTKGVGRTAPKEQNFTNLDGAIVPMGPGHQDPARNSSLLYNEFIVYKLEQIKIKYILKTKFNYRR